MQWRNIKLIWQREVRDQVRDRRTLFTIAVLPLLLYPLFGMLFLRVSQFLREHPTVVAVVGSENLPDDPPLLKSNDADPTHHVFQFVPAASDLLEVRELGGIDADATPAEVQEAITNHVQSGRFDAVLYFPPNFRQRLAKFREIVGKIPASESNANPQATPPDANNPQPTPNVATETSEARPPEPQIFYNAASDKSKIAHRRLAEVLDNWRRDMVRSNLAAHHVPAGVTEPFSIRGQDLAPPNRKQAAIWSKILPFVALIWALTGAFYPAIDLCAGEKERGTLETLLSSPAQRSEIVCGKLLTVMVFSMATAILNLASMGITGLFITPYLQRMAPAGADMLLGPPPLFAATWLLLALAPISALFSALAMAVASLARSSKEGQYYLMPILLISLPLMILPILPSAELDWGMSLIPITGVMLLLRTLIEGRYLEALKFALPVLGMTGICCFLAIRWAIDQFNNESVLFRENERWDLSSWMRHLVRDREDTPSFSQGILCGVLLLVINFLAAFAIPEATNFKQFAFTQISVHVAMIITPVLLMALILTRSPRKTLLLNLPAPLAIPQAALLAILLHPAVMAVAAVVKGLYPVSPDLTNQLAKLAPMFESAGLPALLLVLALLPAISEELAFRGFVLSGLRHMGHKWTAIFLSSLLFGAIHTILQQQISAFVVGMVIAYLAIQSGSLLPGMVFHFTNNALGLCLGYLTADTLQGTPLEQIFVATKEGPVYTWTWGFVATLLAAAIVLWFRRLPYQRTAEEKLQESMEQHAATAW